MEVLVDVVDGAEVLIREQLALIRFFCRLLDVDGRWENLGCFDVTVLFARVLSLTV